MGSAVALAAPQSAVLRVVDRPAGGLPVSLVARVVVPVVARQAESLAVVQVAAQEAVVGGQAVVLVAVVAVGRAEARRADRAARPVVDPLATLMRGRKGWRPVILVAARLAAHATGLFLVLRPQR